MTQAPRRLPIWPGDEPPDGRVSPGARTQLRLEALSSHVMSGVRQVAVEGDELFVLAVSGVGSGIERAVEGIAGIGRRVSLGKLAIRLGLRVEQTTRDRIRRLLAEEAKRAPIEVTPEEFDEFSEKMGILFELIFSGVIRIEDIVLEADDADERAALGTTEDNGQLSLRGFG